MAIIQKPMIQNLTLTIRKDIANCEATVDYDVNFDSFAQLTNVSFIEAWSLVGVDPQKNDTIYSGPVAIGGIRSNGNATIHRSHTARIPWVDLDEDPNDPNDEIAAVVTLTPKLPDVVTAQSVSLVVSAP